MSIATAPLFQRLLARSPFSEHELIVLIATASSRYKVHYIEKRGGRGRREIAQPTKEIKYLQRMLIKHELATLPIHDAAVAYRAGLSIADHARLHAQARYLLKLDFKNFFPSIKWPALAHRLTRDTQYTKVELWILGNLLCREAKSTGVHQLSIGAPSSPHVSNYVLCEFDSKLTDFCSNHGVRYTRYADDLALSTSTPGTLDVVEQKVRHLLEELDYLGLQLNEEKSVNVSKKRRRTLVGLTLSNDGHASIGRDAKRQLRGAIHRAALGTLGPEDLANLKGRMAFVYAFDPAFVDQLLARYGFTSIATIVGDVPNSVGDVPNSVERMR
jgi:RNA-directed DNA polymerase